MAIDTLRKAFGVTASAYLPYDALLTLLAYAFAKQRERSLSAEQMEWVSQWFWRASFGLYYGAGGATRIGRDRETFDRMLSGDTTPPEIPVNLTVGRLVGTKMTRPRSAIRNAILCLLATRNPTHLLNNTPLNLVDGSISDFTSAEKHHIFPSAFLRDQGQDEATAHAVPNFCYLPSDLNKLISNRSPSAYFSELRAKNPGLDTSSLTQLLPLPEEDCIQNDDYIEFLQQRAEILLEEIHRMCGITTTPRPEQRNVIIESLEKRLRELIHIQLYARNGRDYWKRTIPEDIRVQVQERMNTAADKPGWVESDSPRTRLDYMNVMDYATVICNRGNWDAFVPFFRRKEDVQNHLKNFSEYRNSVMHSRSMTEYVRLGGERAIIWMESLLAEEDNVADSPGEEDE